MWSAERRRARAPVHLGLMLGLVLGACGFEPMYGEQRGNAVHAELQTVRVAPIANRTGQLLRQYIEDRIHSSNATPAALYQLEVGVLETRQYYGIQRDLSATYSRLALTANFTLRDVRTRQAVLTGSFNVYSSYNVAADPFSTVVAENDARERGVHSLGDELINRVSFFLRKSTPPASG